MTGFDTVIVVDWSARSAPSSIKPTKDAIFIAEVTGARTHVSYHRTRASAQTALTEHFRAALRDGRRTLAGFDFPFSYPRGFAEAVTGRRDVFALWEWLDEWIEDDDRNRNNRFDVAEALNRHFPGVGPFWGCHAHRATSDLPARGSLRRNHGMCERREVEKQIRRSQPCWKLFTTGSVGSQVLLGLPRLEALRRYFGQDIAVRPFESRDAPIILAEIYPSLLDAVVKKRQMSGEVFDAAQVRVLANAFAGLNSERLDAILREGDPEEGWIAGLGHEEALIAALG